MDYYFKIQVSPRFVCVFDIYYFEIQVSPRFVSVFDIYCSTVSFSCSLSPECSLVLSVDSGVAEVL